MNNPGKIHRIDVRYNDDNEVVGIDYWFESINGVSIITEFPSVSRVRELMQPIQIALVLLGTDPEVVSIGVKE